MNAASTSTSSAGSAVLAEAAAHSYLHASAAFDDELGRLGLLEARWQPSMILGF